MGLFKNRMSPSMRRTYVVSTLFCAGVAFAFPGLPFSVAGCLVTGAILVFLWPSNPALKAAEERKQLEERAGG
jgi:hypothetical protein